MLPLYLALGMETMNLDLDQLNLYLSPNIQLERLKPLLDQLDQLELVLRPRLLDLNMYLHHIEFPLFLSPLLGEVTALLYICSLERERDWKHETRRYHYYYLRMDRSKGCGHHKKGRREQVTHQ